MFCHRYSVEFKECTFTQPVVHIVVHLQNQPKSLKKQMNHKRCPDRLQSTLLKASTWNWEHFWFSPHGSNDWQDLLQLGRTSFPKDKYFHCCQRGAWEDAGTKMQKSMETCHTLKFLFFNPQIHFKKCLLVNHSTIGQEQTDMPEPRPFAPKSFDWEGERIMCAVVTGYRREHLPIACQQCISSRRVSGSTVRGNPYKSEPGSPSTTLHCTH